MPKTTLQNLSLFVLAFLLSLLLTLSSSILKQLTTIPDDQPINLRIIMVDVLSYIITIIPLLAAGLGLPALGKEGITALASQLGKAETTKRLTKTEPDVDIKKLASAVLDEKERRDAVTNKKQSTTS